MVKFVISLAVLTGFTFIMWENLEEKASVYFLGKTVFENVPILLIIMTSMLAGMLLMFPLMWINRLTSRSKKKAKVRGKNKDAKQAAPEASEKGATAASEDDKKVLLS